MEKENSFSSSTTASTALSTFCRLVGRRQSTQRNKRGGCQKNKQLVESFKIECSQFDEVALDSRSKRKHISITSLSDVCSHCLELLEGTDFHPIRTPGCSGNWQTPNIAKYFKQICDSNRNTTVDRNSAINVSTISTGGCTWCCGKCDKCTARLQNYFRQKESSSVGKRSTLPRGFAASLMVMKDNELIHNDNAYFCSGDQSSAESQYISDVLEAADSNIQSIHNRFVLEDTFQITNEKQIWRFRLPKVGIECIGTDDLGTVAFSEVKTIWPDIAYGSLLYAHNDFASVLAVRTKHKNSSTQHVHYACNCRSKQGREGKLTLTVFVTYLG